MRGLQVASPSNSTSSEVVRLSALVAAYGPALPFLELVEAEVGMLVAMVRVQVAEDKAAREAGEVT